jgi:hypothetical protein
MTNEPVVPRESIEAFDCFVDKCAVGTSQFSLIPEGTVSPFALCFGIFALHLTRRQTLIAKHREAYATELLNNLAIQRKLCTQATRDKSYRQLLTLSLSALSILEALQSQVLDELVFEQVSQDTELVLKASGALKGLPQSGNQAMFQAILLIHACRYLGDVATSDLEKWLDLHQASMNEFGFWGHGLGPTHLHFQNGYHQYEIFEYLGFKAGRGGEAARSVVGLADLDGHFAPYPGGGACFDYDAVFLLTLGGNVADEPNVAEVLIRTFRTLSSEQNTDGGFCENRLLRPRYRAFPRYVERLLSSKNLAVLRERVRYALSLQRTKHDRLSSHWSNESRGWSDSDLFSSWFRLLALARIESAFSPLRAKSWGFIDYPGIGWHPSLQKVE